MPLHPPPATDPADHPPPQPDPAALRAHLAATAGDRWRASLFMRRLAALREHLGELRARLAALPRRLRRAWARRWAWALPAAALLLALAAGQAQAAAITVDRTGSGCTLDDAITAANTDMATGSCPAGSGPDTINFQNANTTYSLDTNYGAALPDVTTVVTIQGNGTTTLDAEGAFGVLRVTGGGSLALSNATITGGSTAANGGGIFVDSSTLSLTSTTISGNTAYFRGGGIHAAGSTVNGTSVTISGNSASTGGGLYAVGAVVSLTSATISGNTADTGRGGGIYISVGTLGLTSATISGNSAAGNGGGISAISGASVTLASATVSGNTSGIIGGGIFTGSGRLDLTNTTISGNSAAGSGGGIFAAFGTVSLTNGTISGNTAANNGGGIYVSTGVVSLTHATVTGNSASIGGGVRAFSSYYVGYSTVTFQNSIVAGQAAGTDCSGGNFVSGGYNIESTTSCGFTGTGDQDGVGAGALMLGPLASNPPGTTQTHALGSGSAAQDQIPPGQNGCGTTYTSDQRGVTRPQFTNCDVGAYELEPATPTPPATLTPLPTQTPVATPTAIAPTAAEITHFAAVADPTGRVRVTWETASEVDSAGFRVQRASGDGPWIAVGGLVPARGGATGGARYAVADAPGVGAFAYRLEVVDAVAAGAPRIHGPVEAIVRAIRAFLPWGRG